MEDIIRDLAKFKERFRAQEWTPNETVSVISMLNMLITEATMRNRKKDSTVTIKVKVDDTEVRDLQSRLRDIERSVLENNKILFKYPKD